MDGPFTTSIVIPVLNEAPAITDRLLALAGLRARGVEVVVADGGSTDDTCARADSLCDRLVGAPRGRAAQMNAGAAVSRGDLLLFLHADTILPVGATDGLAQRLAVAGHRWGRFDVAIDGQHPMLGMVAAAMNLRSRWTGIATGDQAIFVTRAAFEAAGGFPDLPLMEDIAFSRAMKAFGPPLCLRDKVVTSGRRWESRGLWRTIWLMWRLRLAFWRGADPARLARLYGYVPRDP
jgi:rSAM/selenodomain-associated transferase 2